MNEFQKAYADYEKNITSLDIAYKSSGSLGRTFINWDGSNTIKSDYNRSDYDHFRPTQPKNRQQILKVCQDAYDKVGIIQNVINLMSDFASKGIKIKHEVPAIERFYQKWFEKVQGVERSERFLNTLFRLGSVVVYKSYGVIPLNTENDLKKIHADIEKDGELSLIKYKNRYIPIKYTFLNPGLVEVIGENSGISLGRNIYVLKLEENYLSVTNNYLISRSNSPEITKLITEGLPSSLREAIIKKKRYYTLEEDRVSVYHYKKDDWQSWGKPITFCILQDLQVLEKLKLADISALDGAISNVRLWTVGKIGDTPQTTYLPGKPVLEKIRNILANNIGGGTLDLVWGPELTFKDSSTNVHQFLGEQKYKPTIDNIYDGLGIPSPLRSGSTSSKSNDYVSLKTLIERLNYGRSMLADFWAKEIEIVQKACGFSKPAVIEYDYMVFTDEAAEKQLLINLADRDIISNETLREKFNMNHKIEEAKMTRDKKKRGKKIPHKAGPFHNAQPEHEYKKILLGAGMVTPSEVELDLSPKKPGEVTRQEMLNQQKDKEIKQARKFSDTPGRPQNVVETTKRNPKTGQDIKISKANHLMIWSSSAQDFIHKTLVSGLEPIFGKKNLRQLTEQEFEEFERMKCNLLFSFAPFEELTLDKLHAKLLEYKDLNVYEDVQFMSSEAQMSLGRDLTTDEKRSFSVLLYVQKHEK